MSRADGQNQPRAMIHRRILDVAASNPDASLAGIAGEVSGASESLVGRVLDEYGDPASEDHPESEQNADADAVAPEYEESVTEETDCDAEATEGDFAETDDDQSAVAIAAAESADGGSVTDRTDPAGEATADRPNCDSDETTAPMNANTNGQQANGNGDRPDQDVALSEKQRETLRVVSERPDASQAEIADALDVTRATVSRRLNAIAGFDWADRRAFAERFLADSPGPVSGDAEPAADPEVEPIDDSRPQTTDDGRPSHGDGDQRDDGVDGSHGHRSGAGVAGDAGDLRQTLARLDERVAALEAESETGESQADTDTSDAVTASLTPALAHKVLRACMESDRLTEDEELALLRSLVGD